jgi:hypothetical protein
VISKILYWAALPLRTVILIAVLLLLFAFCATTLTFMALFCAFAFFVGVADYGCRFLKFGWL